MATSTPEPKRTLQLTIPKKVFNHFYVKIKNVLPPSFYAKPNSKYSTKDIVEYLFMMCGLNASHEGISQMMRDEINKDSVPTGACLLLRVGGSAYPVTREACYKMFDATLKEPRVARLWKKVVITATDQHDIPAKFKNIDEECMDTGYPKGGTSKRIRYTTIKIVGGSAGLTLNIHPTGKKYNKADIVRHQLEEIRKLGVRSKLHLLDRGFYTSEVLLALINMDQRFVMPAVKNKAIVRIIEDYARGTGKAVQRYTVRGKNGEVEITLVIVPKKNAKDTDPPKDRFLVFATNYSMREARTIIANIPIEYKKRWGIETGYRVAKQVRPFTCSRNMSVRLVLFFFTMILYNLWVVSCYIASDGKTCKDDGVYVRPPIAMYRMMRSLCAACEKMIKNRIISYTFFPVPVT